MFNTLRYAKMLEEVGFSREQSETAIKILVEIMEDKLASKQDLKELKNASANDLQEFKAEVRVEFKQVYAKFDLLESRLTVKMGTMLAASIAIITAIQKWVH